MAVGEERRVDSGEVGEVEMSLWPGLVRMYRVFVGVGSLDRIVL